MFCAELQFRLAAAVNLAITCETQPLDLPTKWSHGQHVVSYNEIALRPDQAQVAGPILFHSATFLLAVAVRDAIAQWVADPKNSDNPNVFGAYQISRMIRNSFTHNPFAPVWSVDENCRDKAFTVTEIISLDTTGLNGQPFNEWHYGGPLALLKLCQFTRFEIVGDTSKRPSDRALPDPEKVIYQQGPVVAQKIG